jgi:hypothetical protein
MSLIKPDSPLTERQAKYCSCLLEKRANDMDRGTVGQYNDYAVCTSSTRGHVYSCTPYYDFEHMDERYIRAYYDLHNKPYQFSHTREMQRDVVEFFSDGSYNATGQLVDAYPLRDDDEVPSYLLREGIHYEFTREANRNGLYTILMYEEKHGYKYYRLFVANISPSQPRSGDVIITYYPPRIAEIGPQLRPGGPCIFEVWEQSRPLSSARRSPGVQTVVIPGRLVQETEIHTVSGGRSPRREYPTGGKPEDYSLGMQPQLFDGYLPLPSQAYDLY